MLTFLLAVLSGCPQATVAPPGACEPEEVPECEHDLDWEGFTAGCIEAAWKAGTKGSQAGEACDEYDDRPGSSAAPDWCGGFAEDEEGCVSLCYYAYEGGWRECYEVAYGTAYTEASVAAGCE